MKIVQLGAEHLPTILDYRYAMMEESNYAHVLADDWREVTEGIYASMYVDGRGAHFGAFAEDRLVAISGCIIRNDFPMPSLKVRRFGWIMDVYVIPEFRSRGLAKQLTQETIDWLYSRNISLIKLNASKTARDYALYEKFGFTLTMEMMHRRPEPAGAM